MIEVPRLQYPQYSHEPELHTVFSVPKDKIVALIDEAWTLKGNPLAFDPVVYIVDMKRTIGIDGETAIRIVVKKAGTSEIKTAYPVKLGLKGAI